MLATRALFTGPAPAFPASEDDEVPSLATLQRTTNLDTGANNNVATFDTEVEDDLDIIDLGSSASKIGPAGASLAGKVAELHAEAIWLNDNSGYKELKVFRNGNASEPIAVVQLNTAPNNTGLQLHSRKFTLVEGDYFELVCRSGSDDRVFAGPDYSLFFQLAVYGA